MDSGKPLCAHEVINLYSGEIKGYNLNLMKSIHGICPSELFTQNKIQYAQARSFDLVFVGAMLF